MLTHFRRRCLRQGCCKEGQDDAELMHVSPQSENGTLKTEHYFGNSNSAGSMVAFNCQSQYSSSLRMPLSMAQTRLTGRMVWVSIQTLMLTAVLGPLFLALAT